MFNKKAVMLHQLQRTPPMWPVFIFNDADDWLRNMQSRRTAELAQEIFDRRAIKSGV